MITPFAEGEKRKNTISYGLSSCGYDIRLAEEVRVCVCRNRYDDPLHRAMLDPKSNDVRENFSSPLRIFPSDHGNYVVVPSHSFVLGYSVERIKMPDSVVATCVGKSTYARCGLIVNVTPIEPGWEGHITLEISNTTPLPAKLYVNEGIAQLVFHITPSRPESTYAGKRGKYQDQGPEITFPRVD